MINTKKHEELRKQVWIDAWTRTAGASNIVEKEKADEWADHALKSFDERFSPNTQPDTSNHQMD